MDFERINDKMIIGANSYVTDLEVEWEFKALSTIGLGVGYNYVHKSGISCDLGVGVPIAVKGPFHNNIKLYPTKNVNIDQADYNSAVAYIEGEMFYFPIQFHINLGFNLADISKKK